MELYNEYGSEVQFHNFKHRYPQMFIYALLLKKNKCSYIWRQISANIHVDINSTCFRIEVNFDIEHIKFSMPLQFNIASISTCFPH